MGFAHARTWHIRGKDRLERNILPLTEADKLVPKMVQHELQHCTTKRRSDAMPEVKAWTKADRRA